MATIDIGLFIILIIFAVIGALLVGFLILYFFAYLLDITYYSRHNIEQKESEKNCPYEIEKEDEK